ncbi:type II toxin-antitoxin system RelE/ParE family toxin [Methylorubrum populi]|uniref:Uncharacterized protein n=1 Tax=Methylorubrum populi TaxID=223967 RepID=A0A514KTG5_9HYPH|nr:type II toxin-antitoxin system RelE/ParE family toxin [Methylorubrum populi]KAB7783384.1 hypothetical protein F8B43_4678 [Methylorubrum populi]QDI82910.1 type II toxin-antitoxin system RelE/ParE family toxin [Methylorubrum populi]
MGRAVFLASAQADLVQILEDITRASGSLATGQIFVRQLRAQCHRLAALPGTLGRARPDLLPDIRSSPYRGYIIFFRYLGDTFEVVNILHSRRDIDDFFATDATS